MSIRIDDSDDRYEMSNAKRTLETSRYYADRYNETTLATSDDLLVLATVYLYGGATINMQHLRNVRSHRAKADNGMAMIW